MTLEQSTVTFGVLAAAAFVFSALYQIYRAVLKEPLPSGDLAAVVGGPAARCHGSA
jgi:hypothetical protein